MQTFKTIDSYIANYPKETQAQLKRLRAAIRKLAPHAQATISYGIPTFKLGGNLVHFGGYVKHVGLYPGASAIVAFKKEISKYHSSKGTVQFPIDKPLPLGLIEKIVKFRIKENKAKSKPSGKHIVYHKDGSIWAKGKLVQGVHEGYWEWFRKDGTKMRSGYFKNGKQTGEWTTYDTHGKPYKSSVLKK